MIKILTKEDIPTKKTELSTTCEKLNRNPAISVIIPVFNRKTRILKTITSVLQQSFTDFELIIIDDGSTDGTNEVLHEIKKTSPQNIEIIKQVNGGVSSARNAGIIKARGEYIAFCDSDDLWISSKLEEQIMTMRSNSWKICQTEETWIRNGKQVNSMKKHKKCSGDIFIQSLYLCLVSPSAVMIKKEIFNEIGLFDEKLRACEDFDLWLRILLKHPIYLYEKALIYKTGGHDDQLSRKYWGMDRFRIYAIEKHLFTSMRYDYKKALIDTLIAKTTVLINGSYKRKKWLRYLSYRYKLLKYKLAQIYYGIKTT
jgi:glycosyltransferase involved in cell wall biosynthesis